MDQTINIDRAMELHRNGRLAEAEALYRRLVVLEPKNADAAHFLGILLHGSGRNEEAVVWLTRATGISPTTADFYSNLGVVLEAMGRAAESIEACSRAVTLKPDHAGAWYNLGNAYRLDKQYDIAIEAYSRSLELRPDFFEALSNLGATYRMAGRPQDMVDSYRRAVAIQGRNAVAWNNLAQALAAVGQAQEAIGMFRHAIELDPNFADAHNDLGAALLDIGRDNEAIECCRRALELKSNFAEALNNLGNGLSHQGKHEEALESYRRALAVRPELAEAHNNMSIDLLALGRYEEAIEATKRALELKPAFPAAYNSLGNIFSETGRFAEAAAAYQMAVAVQADYVEAMSNLGNLFRDHGQPQEAIACYQRALQIRPNYADAHNNLGTMYYDMGLVGESIACFRRAMELRPEYYKAENNLATALKDLGQVPEAIRLYEHAHAGRPENASIHSNLIYSLHCMVELTAEEIFQRHLDWDRKHAAKFREAWPKYERSRGPDRPLRVGFVSPDLRMHSVSFFLLPILEAHHRDRVSMTCYQTIPREDEATARLRAASDGWRSLVGLSDAAAAEQIRRDEIDILVDLSGHTARNRLMVFARKAAPVQLSFLGYPNTTGMAAMDWRISDYQADPVGVDGLYTEKLWRLHRPAWCFSPLSGSPEVQEARRDCVAFGCFNDLAKVNEPLMETWAKILRSVPNSKLLMKSRGSSAPLAGEWVRGNFEKHGVAGERIVMLPRQAESGKHLETYGGVDIALDTYPYHGTTTTCESLWMGAPVVTRAGRTHLSRVGVSLLGGVGLNEMVAENEEQYVKIAVELAHDRGRLAELRRTLRERMSGSALMDRESYVRDIEDALVGMWGQR